MKNDESRPANTQFDDTPWLDPDARPLIQIQGLTKKFADATAVNNVDLDIFQGELFTILGGSGSGKTTLLRLLGGFEHPTMGRILIDGTDMTTVPPYQRPVNMMFQSYALFPHMTVEQNVAYGLKKEGTPSAEIKDRVAKMLELVKLPSLAKRKPANLSGGERQRVALARALIKRPKVLLLDEPLAALDKKLREHTQFELMNLQEELGITFIVVTHDQEEAMTLSTRIAVMNEGRFEQVGTPGEVYEYPANRFTADFIGTINLLETRVLDSADGLLRLACDATGGELTACSSKDSEIGSRRWLAVRPEKIFIDKNPPPANNRTVLKGIVLDLGYFGNLSIYRVQLPTGTMLQVSAQNRQRTAHRTVEWDDEVYVSWDIASAIILDQ
jgi:putrescine transport system ATP-binding protein